MTCRDPAGDAEPEAAIAAHRVALDECERRRALAVSTYEMVRQSIETAKDMTK